MWSAIYARHPVTIADSSNDAAASIIVCHQYSAFGFIVRMMAWVMRPRQSVFRRAAWRRYGRWYHAKVARLPNAARPFAAASPMRAPDLGRHRARPHSTRTSESAACGPIGLAVVERYAVGAVRRGESHAEEPLYRRLQRSPPSARRQESCEACPCPERATDGRRHVATRRLTNVASPRQPDTVVGITCRSVRCWRGWRRGWCRRAPFLHIRNGVVYSPSRHRDVPKSREFNGGVFVPGGRNLKFATFDVGRSHRGPHWIPIDPSKGEFHVYSSSFWAVCIRN
jgi:hypothetical protein